MADSACNHLYLFEDKPKSKTVKAVGYIRQDSDEVAFFKNGLIMNFKNRTFVEVKKVKV
jgi:hypothetical protein